MGLRGRAWLLPALLAALAGQGRGGGLSRIGLGAGPPGAGGRRVRGQVGLGRPFAGRGSRVPSQVFVDEDGREVVLHGTNAVVKGPPWVPVADEFSADLSMTDADFAIMRDLGLTVVRLGVMWPGVEPERGVYNETYLDIVADIVERAERHDVYVLMDMHQDVLADRFCGEGLPD